MIPLPPVDRLTRAAPRAKKSGALPNASEAGIFVGAGGIAAAIAAVPPPATGHPWADAALGAASLLGGIGATSAVALWFRRIRPRKRGVPDAATASTRRPRDDTRG